MRFVPLHYNLRSLIVRRTSTALTVLGIGATVAVLAGVLALQQGFETLFTQGGRDDVVVFLRPGSTNETDSFFTRENCRTLINSHPEIATDNEGRPMASAESFLAVRLRKTDGGETNVPIRGVQQGSITLARERLKIIEGRQFKQGADEVIVGKKLTHRIRGCKVGDVLWLNTVPCTVVGVFEYDGPFESEIWLDIERMADALERPVFNRVIARLDADADLDEFKEKLENDSLVAAIVKTEQEYLAGLTMALSMALTTLGIGLAVIMGIAAVFTATNTMLAALVSRTHEIGILLPAGFKPFAIFTSFLFEALLLSLLGGIAGCLLALPINGIETGTSNFQTFTEVAFAFRVTPTVLITAVVFSLILGLIGGAWPAMRAARLTPTEALRRR